MELVPSAPRLLHAQAEKPPLARPRHKAKGSSSQQQLEVKLDYTELVKIKVMVISSTFRQKLFCYELF